MNPSISTRYHKAIRKYRADHIEPEAQLVADALGKLQQPSWDCVVSIPVAKDGRSFKAAIPFLMAAAEQLSGRALLLVVINGAEGQTHEAADNNKDLWESLQRPDQGQVDIEVQGQSRWLLWQTAKLDLVVIDRFSEGRLLPPGEGVGLARKIGNDVALELVVRELVRSSWVANTDADAKVPPSYFQEVAALSNLGKSKLTAILFAFQHCDWQQRQVAAIDLRTRLYDRYLHHYADGLRAAGSPYGFISLGSVINFEAGAYAAVRGHPKRLAGEDFYLLNKLAKLGPVEERPTPIVELQTRESDRVPFGTGAAVLKLMELATPEQEYLVYDPLVFKALADVISSACEHGLTAPDQFFANLDEKLSHWCDADTSQRVIKMVQELDFAAAFARMITLAKGQLPRQSELFHEWFDGFRTLKLVHQLRDKIWPDQPWQVVFPSN